MASMLLAGLMPTVVDGCCRAVPQIRRPQRSSSFSALSAVAHGWRSAGPTTFVWIARIIRPTILPEPKSGLPTMEFVFTVPADLAERLDAIAARHSWSRSQVVEALCRRGLEHFTESPPSGQVAPVAIDAGLRVAKEAFDSSRCEANAESFGDDGILVARCPLDADDIDESVQSDCPIQPSADRPCRHCGGRRFGHRGIDLICLDCRDNEGQEFRHPEVG